MLRRRRDYGSRFTSASRDRAKKKPKPKPAIYVGSTHAHTHAFTHTFPFLSSSWPFPSPSPAAAPTETSRKKGKGELSLDKCRDHKFFLSLSLAGQQSFPSSSFRRRFTQSGKKYLRFSHCFAGRSFLEGSGETLS